MIENKDWTAEYDKMGTVEVRPVPGRAILFTLAELKALVKEVEDYTNED